MEIAMRAIGPLLPKLGSLLAGEFTLEKRVRKGVEFLVIEMTLMEAALRKVANVPSEQLDEGFKIWAGNVKELSYQMDDIVETFMMSVEHDGEPASPENRVKKLFKKATTFFKKRRDFHSISDALQEVVGQAKQLAELRQRYELAHDNDVVGASFDPRMMALYTDMTELVGIEEKQDTLINMLIEGDDWQKNPVKTVSIVGFGGLGKTTLAKAVYDKIKGQFQCCAFASVSQYPNRKKILKDILFELDKIKYANIHNAAMEEKHLIDELIEFLSDKRYFVIIDDIWDKEVWRLIKCAFPKNSLGSRLITTTRIVSVAKACCSSMDDIYKMEHLSHDVSRRLFYKRVFSHEKGCPSEFVQISDEILQKCGGIPLAIVTIASVLADNHQIKTKAQWYALLNSIGSGVTDDHIVDEMKKILLLSYYDLPSYLKPCLLYLSIFPEDHKIMREKLILKWISEGFVYSEKQETSLYELGDRYFSELVNRSMVQPIDIGDDKKIEACRVHDMMHDLICSLASEESFVTILDGIERKMPNSRSKVRRFSFQITEVDVDTTRMKQVRSITVFTNSIVGQVLNISSFQILRVLDLEGCDISAIGYVGNLLHLRYLGLSNTNVEVLPMEIGKLQFLQTLDLKGTRIKELSSCVVLLKHLICLYVHTDMKLPSGIGNLTSLEVLDGVNVKQLPSGILNLHVVKELGHLSKLRVLRFELGDLNENLEKALLESLGNLHKLECLGMYASHGGYLDLMCLAGCPL